MALPKQSRWLFGKLAKAVEILITDPRDARDRMRSASDYLMMLHPDGVPERCRPDVLWIQHMLTRYPADRYSRSALEATYRRTRNVTASKIAVRVWKLYHEYESAFNAEQQGLGQVRRTTNSSSARARKVS